MGNMTLLNVSVDWCMGGKGNTLKECGRSLYNNVDTSPRQILNEKDTVNGK